MQGLINDQGLRFAVTLPSMKDYGIGSTKKLLNDGQELLKYLQSGKKMRKTLKSAAQKQAAEFLETITVDGVPPTEPEPLTAALHRLEAQVAAVQLVQLWNEAGVAVSNDHVTRTLSELEDNDRVLGHVYTAVTARETMVTQLRQQNLTSDLSTVAAVLHLLDAIPAALAYLSLENARNQVNALYQAVASWAAKPQAASELAILVEAINRRDVGAYRLGLSALDTARQEQSDEKQLGAFSRTLNNIHPQLFDMLVRSVDEPAWEERLGDLHGAWAWSKAEQYVLATRNADEERKLVAEFEQVDTQISKLTARLAGNHALDACVSRVTDNQARALRTYREMMGHVGLGGGSKTREYRRAARQALEKAKDAVPAWVVPLSGLLENITAARNSFDVIIVDEASQVGLEQLFLLWMAPRVIVVGDDRQCTPGESRLGKLGPIFDRLKEHLGDIDESIRNNFTSKSNLYGLLSARSGKNSVVRLREHFRCVPEIINWSSTQFYGDAGVPGLVALRERKATDLKPLQVVHVEDGETTGHNTTMRNLPEARRIVAQMAECLADPQYRDKTFGVVVLQGIGQVKLLEHEINVAISVEEREHRKIRVGTPPDFQGDERDVIFLSMVVTGTPRIRRATPYQQAYNVAASRAKDQMWLFTSVRHSDLKPDDLRGSLLGYMEKPPSVFGKSPALEEVSETQPHEQFDSLFEQRVFREIRGRGYFVVPQYKVGTRSLDLVVVGDGGRLAIECDGHHWHTSVDQQVSDARRDRELHRMKWDVLRIRESEFEFDKDRELATVWQRLEERQIHPGDIISSADDTGWSPVALDDDDATNESDEG